MELDVGATAFPLDAFRCWVQARPVSAMCLTDGWEMEDIQHGLQPSQGRLDVTH